MARDAMVKGAYFPRMNSWLIYPAWQNFSSLFRETTLASDEKSDFLRCHHLTSALYYAITFVEALLNEQYRRRLEASGIAEEEIMKILRSGSSAQRPDKGRGFARKFSEWPALICGKPMTVSPQLQKVLTEFNEIRSNLTHPKTRGHDTYADLERVKGEELLQAVAEYAVAIYAGLGEEYPYWLFGWNYLNPNKSGWDPTRINNQQFVHSLEYLGVEVHAFDAHASRAWTQAHMTNVDGYKKTAEFLASCRDCEPFDPSIPIRPRLVRRWWESDIFEKNKDYVKERKPPTIYGTWAIAPMMFAFDVYEKPRADSAQS